MRRIAIVLAAILAGCFTRSPYDYMENWLVRDDAIRSFAVGADVIYLQDRLYDDMSAVSTMDAYARSEVGGERFTGVARVFSPLVACADDLELALKWYFRHRHEGRRFFVFIGEGRGGALLKDYETAHYESLKDDGLVVSYYTDDTSGGFVTDKMVGEIRNAITRMRYRDQWGRDMPEGMLKE